MNNHRADDSSTPHSFDSIVAEDQAKVAYADTHSGRRTSAVVLDEYSGGVLHVEHISRTYQTRKKSVAALRDVSLTLNPGTFTAVMGPSGSGKSTLLQCVAGLDSPDSGRVSLGPTVITDLWEPEITRFRGERVGFIFQSYNLIESLTAEENILLSARLVNAEVDRKWFDTVVAEVGIGSQLGQLPGQLSGGQAQRVAVARALITKPAVIFADEPTGALDIRTSHQVLSLLRDVVRDFGLRVLMVTHDPYAAEWADRVVFLADGQLRDDLDSPNAEQIAQTLTALGQW